MERGGRALFLRIRSIAAPSKTNNNNGLYFSATMAAPAIFSTFFSLLRAFYAATLHHTAKRRLDHIQQPTGWHRQALHHVPRPMDAVAWLELRQVHLDKAR